jgi:hypothetical protein
MAAALGTALIASLAVPRSDRTTARTVSRPDDRFLYFSRYDRGSEQYEFYRYELASSRPEDLLPNTPDLSTLPDFALSLDGTHIAMTASHGDGFSMSVMPATVCPGATGLTHLAHHPCVESSPR